MTKHRFHSFAGLALFAGAAAWSAWSATAVAQSRQPRAWSLPRTLDGQPDFQGMWANNAVTPLERPPALAGKTLLTDDELADLKRRAAKILDGGDALFGDQLFAAALASKNGSQSYDATGNYGQQWMADREWDNRTSLIVDPPDGRRPPFTPQAQSRRAVLAEERRRHPADSWLDRTLVERCITFGVNKMLYAGYNSYVEIVQARDYVVVKMEMIHDARIIPLDGRPHLPSPITQWLGDSRGHWEGDTLVVDTTNFSAKGDDLSIGGARLHAIERFTRVSPDSLEYQVTYDDPDTWVRPWTAMVLLKRTKDRMYEYACHEGNHAMTGILAGARAVERAAGSGR